MTNIFSGVESRQRILLGVFGTVILIGVGFVWYTIFGGSSFSRSVTQSGPRSIDLDFRVLSDPAFRELGLKQRVIPFPEGVGRQNPFIQATVSAPVPVP